MGETVESRQKGGVKQKQITEGKKCEAALEK